MKDKQADTADEQAKKAGEMVEEDHGSVADADEKSTV